MPDRYNPREIEKKWQERWEGEGLYRMREDDPRPKWYFLTMFPYTSGDLHIGHWYPMAPSDVAARFKRMQGYNVFEPMGFDAFGLPAENAAIQRGIHPSTWTMQNIQNMRRQLRTLGAMYDWEREVITCDPEYYRWNQWLFLQLYKKGLAYRAHAPAVWCPGCQTTLANEQVEGEGVCERCKTPVTRRDLEQWFFRITQYADELLDHSKLQWPERIYTMQKHWIGRSEGVEVSFALERDDPSTSSGQAPSTSPSTGSRHGESPLETGQSSGQGLEEKEIRVFTTRIDTVYGVTFMVLAPEHPLVPKLATPDRWPEVEAYIERTRRLTEIERQSTETEKTGVFIGAYCVNHLNGQRIPIYIADYALMHYGTGAVMGVPAHDTRDFAFAKRYNLPIITVIAPPGWQAEELREAYTEAGTMVNSGPFDGLPSSEGIQRIADYLEQQAWGRRTVTYRLRDWLISRQRYWGTPIPIIFCPQCGTVPVPEGDLPVLLPQDAEFRPTGESPLKYHLGFLHTTCPHCGAAATRETDTMDTFVDSSWYQMRYLSPHYDKGPFDPAVAKRWHPVDQYTGGAEHATMHLMYARFFHKAMRDLGLVDTDEPYLRLFNQGQILGPDGQRMSKSRGNVVAPDDQVERYGADTFRAYLMFLGPWDQGGPYNTEGIVGIFRWFNRVWNLVLEQYHAAAPPGRVEAGAERALRRTTHQTTKRVTEDLERFRFNTMLAALMEYTNALTGPELSALRGTPLYRDALETLLLLLAPTAPHLAEELWQRIGKPFSIHNQAFPVWDEAWAVEEEITLVVQINGRVRDKITAPAGITEAEARKLALDSPRVQGHVSGKEIAQVIYVPGRLINLVVR